MYASWLSIASNRSIDERVRDSKHLSVAVHRRDKRFDTPRADVGKGCGDRLGSSWQAWRRTYKYVYIYIYIYVCMYV